MDLSWVMKILVRGRVLRIYIAIIALFTITASFGLSFRVATKPATLTTTATRLQNDLSSTTAKVVRASMLYGARNNLYERALVTHEKHAERWGQRFQVLREDIASGFWNKPAFILYTVIQELAKSSDDRAEWLM